jgi:hypothetical protein
MFGLSQDPSKYQERQGSRLRSVAGLDGGGTLLHVEDHSAGKRVAPMTGKPVKNKLVGVRPPAGGDLTRMLISAELILKSDGSLDLLICTYYGVNERKRMEDRLREARVMRWNRGLWR